MNNLLTFSCGVFLTLGISWLAFVVGARKQFGDLEPTASVLEEDGSIPEGAELFPKRLSGLAEQGAEEYVALGCIACHTQQVRLVETGFDVERGWGKRPSVARDYVLQTKVLLGHNRIGPDLANLGLRGHSDDHLYRHLYSPQTLSPGSICPPNSFLFEVHDEPAPGSIEISPNGEDHHAEAGDDSHAHAHDASHVVPTLRARKIVTYLQSLKQDYELPEMAFVETKEDTHADEDDNASALAEANATAAVGLPKWLEEQMEAGKKVYMSANSLEGGLCLTCHQPTGLGVAPVYPPLAGSEWVTGDKEILIKILLHGLQGPITVKGTQYGTLPGTDYMLPPPPGAPPGSMSDQKIADVLTFIRNSWGNSASAVTPAEVAAVRAATASRDPAKKWTAEELK